MASLNQQVLLDAIRIPNGTQADLLTTYAEGGSADAVARWKLSPSPTEAAMQNRRLHFYENV